MYKVLCPGEALIDFVASENKLLSKSNNFLKKAGGAPANAAGAMTKLGVDAYFMGTVGKDPFGEYLKSEMEKFNINTSYVSVANESFTTLAFVSIDEHGERDFIFSRGADSMLKIEDTSIVDQFDCIHFASATAFLGGELELSYEKLLHEATIRGKLITFDANYRDALFADKQEYFVKKCKEYIAKSNIVKLSDEEAVLISGIDDLKSAGIEISKLGCDFLLITLGSEGTYIFHKGEITHVESIKVKPVDTTGAGDAFIGTVVAKAVECETLDIENMERIVSIANKVGALTTENFGALESIPNITEIE